MSHFDGGQIRETAEPTVADCCWWFVTVAGGCGRLATVAEVTISGQEMLNMVWLLSNAWTNQRVQLSSDRQKPVAPLGLLGWLLVGKW